jgi:hypothetical protein
MVVAQQQEMLLKTILLTIHFYQFLEQEQQEQIQNQLEMVAITLETQEAMVQVDKQEAVVAVE